MREKVRGLAAALSGAAALPRCLDEALDRLAESAWPEIATTWSKLTLTGFPVELTFKDGDRGLRWAAEVAGPDLAERDRLAAAVAVLEEAGEPASSAIVEHLAALHACAPVLQFGAWIAGRGTDATERLKLYAELPEGTSIADLPIPAALTGALVPRGTMPRMLGIEPRRERIELYLRLPPIDPDDLLPFLQYAGYGWALEALQRGLPDGTRRLSGRRLGLSLAVGSGHVELALFATARTLFAAEPAMLLEVVPGLAALGIPFEPGLVTLGFDSTEERCVPAVGLFPARRQTVRSDQTRSWARFESASAHAQEADILYG